jgi:hypothetical protein
LQQLEVVATFAHQQEQQKKVLLLLLLLHMETDNKKLTGETNFVLSQKTNKQTNKTNKFVTIQASPSSPLDLQFYIIYLFIYYVIFIYLCHIS